MGNKSGFSQVPTLLSHKAGIYRGLEEKVEREQVAKVTGTNKDDSVKKGPKKRDNKKVYPNDPCPCGSGLKYKNCHMKKGGLE